MPSQIKTATWELGTDPGTEVDCAILALEAEMRSNTAKIACLKARKVTDEAQKIVAEIAAELAAGVSDIKDCEEAVTAAVVDRDLHEVLDVRIMELMKNTGKLFEMLGKMREVKGVIGGKVSAGFCVLEGWSWDLLTV
jgi:ribosomal protein S1